MSIFKPETFPVYYNNGVDIVYQACTCCYNINNASSVDYFEKKKYIEKRIKAGHTSILEHAHFALCIAEAPRACISWELTMLSDAFKYLFMKCVENENGTLNILISGSMRAYRHFAIQAAKDNLLDTLAYKEIMRVLSYYSVDVFVHYDDSNPTVCEYVEILIGIIRERYHKFCSIVNEVSDLNWLEDSMMDDYGNHMFDMDRMRYLRLKGMMPI